MNKETVEHIDTLIEADDNKQKVTIHFEKDKLFVSVYGEIDILTPHYVVIRNQTSGKDYFHFILHTQIHEVCT